MMFLSIIPSASALSYFYNKNIFAAVSIYTDREGIQREQNYSSPHS